VSALGGFPWIEGVEKWRRQLTAELEALPETLRLFREGVSNFQRITARLLDATEALEQVTALYVGGMDEAKSRLDDASRSLRAQLASIANDPAGSATSAVEEFTKALSAMAELNPLWRRGSESK
jgi:uncharacterized protein with PIN domain